MKEKAINSSAANKELNAVLNDLKEKGKFEGILVASRSGEIIYENLENINDIKKFTSMCASVLESALGLGKTMGNQIPKKITAELEEKTILIIEISDKTFIIFILNTQTKTNLVLNQLDEYLEKLF
ncbi:hypothetical protein LCGC14_1304070 [marine sediment metagenome]|uniref:Roadblock/LAMTOR2 domain-containing protein n=1 Tax=marine sediment metagenome TaxID=412755 RepID=A0A0F9N5G3_9ZZZZ|nr:MAG: hypothetical protein Lokiarch_18230 [Candidatus Lokiarchaeum sp. GC14_75]